MTAPASKNPEPWAGVSNNLPSALGSGLNNLQSPPRASDPGIPRPVSLSPATDSCWVTRVTSGDSDVEGCGAPGVWRVGMKSGKTLRAFQGPGSPGGTSGWGLEGWRWQWSGLNQGPAAGAPRGEQAGCGRGPVDWVAETQREAGEPGCGPRGGRGLGHAGPALQQAAVVFTEHQPSQGVMGGAPRPR